MVAARIVLFLALLLLPFRLAAATACDPSGADAMAVADAQSAVDGQCDCAGAANHGAYVHCVAGVVNGRVHNNQLSSACGGLVKRCRARSMCGRPGTITCCRVSSKGKTSCSIKPQGTGCTAPKNGAACAGATRTCCDACAAGSCPTTTTTLPAGCGNLVIDGDETCDGDNDFDNGHPPPSSHNTCDFGASGKMRCARPDEPGACHRCCGMGMGFTTGLICSADSQCCGQCITYPLPQGRRCTDCPGGQCCAKPGASCATTACCSGESCVSGTCCANTGAGCNQNTDCCSGNCDTGNLRCN